MEHCFRTALWIFLLIGCLQAAPCKKDFRFEHLQAVTCHENVTFKSPKSVPQSCRNASVEIIKEGLKHAITYCQCKSFQCGYALEALERVEVPSPDHNSSECTGEKEGSLKFKTFLKEFEDIIDRIYSLPEH